MEIQIEHIAQESVLSKIIHERDNIIIALANQVKDLQNEIEKLKRENETLEDGE